MIHNIVTDKNGDEHQAVMDRAKGLPCNQCSLAKLDCESIKAKCVATDRKDKTEVIYKRRIKIGYVKR